MRSSRSFADPHLSWPFGVLLATRADVISYNDQFQALSKAAVTNEAPRTLRVNLAAFTTYLARDPRDCLVLEVPVDVQTGTDRIGFGQALIFYQPVHRKRLISSRYVSRAPLVALDYYRRSPALMFLANETPPPGDIEADLRQRLDELHVGYVVIHPEMIEPNRPVQVLDVLGRIADLARLGSSGDLIAFRRAPLG